MLLAPADSFARIALTSTLTPRAELTPALCDAYAQFSLGHQTPSGSTLFNPGRSGRILQSEIGVYRRPAIGRSIWNVWGAPCILSNLNGISKH